MEFLTSLIRLLSRESELKKRKLQHVGGSTYQRNFNIENDVTETYSALPAIFCAMKRFAILFSTIFHLHQLVKLIFYDKLCEI